MVIVIKDDVVKDNVVQLVVRQPFLYPTDDGIVNLVIQQEH